MSEQWRGIPGWPAYQASDLGGVRSVDRIVPHARGDHLVRGKVLVQTPDREGRLTVTLCTRGVRRHFMVHQLVALTFIGPQPPDLECCHSNGNKQDNRPGNLRYDTSSNNKRDQVRHGTHNRTSRTHCPRNHGLVRPNLSERVLRRRGVRSCWSCEKADSYCRNRGIMDQFEAIADKYYATLDIPVEFR